MARGARLPGSSGFINPNLFQQAAPAAGADLAYTNGASIYLFLRSVCFEFVAAAAVANRFMYFYIRDNNAANAWIWRYRYDTAITNGQSYCFVFALGDPAVSVVTTLGSGVLVVRHGLPAVVLTPGALMGTGVEAIQGADQFSAMFVNGQQFGS